MFDQHYRDKNMDAVVVDINSFRRINERYGRPCGDQMLRRIGGRMRALAREIGGVGSRQGADTFLLYCPHQENYTDVLERLSANLYVDESSNEQVRLRMGVCAVISKDSNIEQRFEYAKLAANAAKNGSQNTVGTYDDAQNRE